MDDTLRSEATDRLLTAYRTREPIDPLTATYEGMDLEDAYAIQLAQMDAFAQDGRTVKGHKVGLTSAAMQRLLGVSEPDYGHLLDDFFYLEHMPIPAERFLQARVEPEMAFVLKRTLQGPAVTVHEAIAAVDFVLPALEIVDSRIRDWKIGLLDTIADNASSGAVVMGPDRVPIHGLDLTAVECAMTCNGQLAGAGTGAAVMGSPLIVLAWLANTLGPRGVALEPGHVVIPRAVCAMIPVAAGDVVTATFTGLGSVTARFEADHA